MLKIEKYKEEIEKFDSGRKDINCYLAQLSNTINPSYCNGVGCSTCLKNSLLELMNELPTYFKHWKKTAVDNKEKALEEYVDCLHFAVSLLNYYEKFDHKYYYHPEYDDCKNDSDTSLDEELEFVFKFAGSAISIESLFILGNQFGFTWNEIYNAYLKKNKINHERQDGGY